MQETQVRSQVWQDPLEEEMATHSSIAAWEIPWTEEPSGLTVHGVSKESDMTERTHTLPKQHYYNPYIRSKKEG